MILDIIHTVPRSQFMKVFAHYSVYVTHNSYVSIQSFEKKTPIFVAIFFCHT